MKEISRPYEQKEPFTCGPSAYMLALEKLGIKWEETKLSHELNRMSEYGVDWQPIWDHAVNILGLKAELKGNASWKDLQRDFKLGAVIAGISIDDNGSPEGHFVGVDDMTEDLIELSDTALPIEEQPRIMSKQEFLMKWWSKDQITMDRRSYLLLRKPK